MERNRQRKNWIIDAVLFVGFVVAMALDLTGLAVHEVLGAAMVVLAGYHLIAHWKWVQSVTCRLIGSAGRQARLCYVTDAGLLVGFGAIGGTGLMISTWLNLPLSDYLWWRDAHVFASLATLALVVVKVGLHWRWVVNVAARGILRSPALAPVPVVARPMAAGTRAGRRDFVRLMGVVSAASLAVGVRVVVDTSAPSASIASAAQPEPTVTPAPTAAVAAVEPGTVGERRGRGRGVGSASGSRQLGSVVAQAPASGDSAPVAPTVATAVPTITSPAPTPVVPVVPTPAAQPTTAATSVTQKPVATVASTTASTATCTVLCTKGCSFPGQCRRYVDKNGNRLCDLGECQG